MPKSFESQNILNIPPEESGRQAVDSLRGYIYQIYQSINAWLGIKEDETLLLEVAEDYAVLAKGILNSTQVKDTKKSGSITLRSDGVKKTITSLWEFQKANSDKLVHINYLTTSIIGREKQLSFPGNNKGLEYWRVAAREGNDVEPMRSALLSLELPKEIIEFIRESPPEDIQNRVLRPVKWICGSEDIVELQQIINDRLVNMGEEKGFLPSDMKGVRHALVSTVLQKIINKKNRALNRADLLRVFEKSGSISIPKSTHRNLIKSLHRNIDIPQIISSADIVMDASKIPFPPRIVHRHNLVNQFITSMKSSGVLWLYGSSGVGKTIMAQFIANQFRRDWWHVSLRNCSGVELNSRLRNVLYSLDSKNFSGLILDDYSLTHSSHTKMSLSILAKEILSMDGFIIIIADKAPPKSVENYFGKNAPHIARYLI